MNDEFPDVTPESTLEVPTVEEPQVPSLKELIAEAQEYILPDLSKDPGTTARKNILAQQISQFKETRYQHTLNLKRLLSLTDDADNKAILIQNEISNIKTYDRNIEMNEQELAAIK